MNLNIEQLKYLDGLSKSAYNGGVLGIAARQAILEDSIAIYESCKKYIEEMYKNIDISKKDRKNSLKANLDLREYVSEKRIDQQQPEHIKQPRPSM